MFKIEKENKKSIVYKSDEYTVKIVERPGVVYKKNNSPYTTYDDDLDENDYKANELFILELTNNKTGKTATKRCYQGYAAIEDIEKDINSNNKKQFGDLFKKVD